MNTIIELSLRYRWIVIFLTLFAAVGGVVSMQQLDLDAFPDTTPVQVQINTTAPSLGPLEVEQQITFPLEQALSGLPHIHQVRSISKFGLSQVVLIFDDGTDIYFARQLVTERLSTVKLPDGLDKPKMGPVSTGLGEVFHYVVTGKGEDQTHLRTIHDWVIRPQMRKVKGVAEINSWGGYERQYQVRIEPNKLAKYGFTFDEVMNAIRTNNQNVGGGIIGRGSSMILVQGLGRTENIEQIKQIPIRAHEGVPIRVGDIADVQIGHELRRGAVTANGQGEVVLGLGFMTMGENSHEVTWNLKKQLDDVKQSLPGNAKVEPVYDRTELVDFVIKTVRTNLFEGGLLVVSVLFLFLGNLRAAFIVALAIPLSLLFAFTGMWKFGIAASLLSLGATRLRHGRRFISCDDRKLCPEALAQHRWTKPTRSDPRCGSGGPQAHALRGTHHSHRVSADSYARRCRRENVPPDGAHGDLRTRWFDAAFHDLHACSGQPTLTEAD